jgi:hypothetical protein
MRRILGNDPLHLCLCFTLGLTLGVAGMSRNAHTGKVRPTSRPVGASAGPLGLSVGTVNGQVSLRVRFGGRELTAPIAPGQARQLARLIDEAADAVDPPADDVPSGNDDLLAESLARIQ